MKPLSALVSNLGFHYAQPQFSSYSHHSISITGSIGSVFWSMRPLYAVLSTYRTCCTKPRISNVSRPKTSSSIEKIGWTEQQLQVLEAVKSKKSVFITGPAGTGKTLLIEEIVKELRKIHGRLGVFVTASTGVAACAINGQTLHSFAGVGLAEAASPTLLSRVLRDKRAFKRWRSARALVIDEISMVDGELFDKLEYIARGVMQAESDEPGTELTWGGIQLIVGGDFFQLPPVDKTKNKKFAFEADCWDRSFDFQVSLDLVFRQSDPEYVRILERIRKGMLDAQDEKLLEQCLCVNECDLDETVVRLFPRNQDVDRVNEMRLQDLREEVVVYEAYDTGREPWKKQLSLGMAPTTVKLCKGARVMLTKNMNVKGKLVNGSTGVVTRFVDISKGNAKKICCYHGGPCLPVVKFDSGEEVMIKPCKWEVNERDMTLATRLQLPLVLAWATSIHKSQGLTLDKLYTNLSRSFGYGMIYVAFSRVKKLKGLYLYGFNPSSVRAHPSVVAFYEKTFGMNGQTSFIEGKQEPLSVSRHL